MVAAVAVPSLELAVTVRLKSASLLPAGVIARPASCAGVSVMLPAVMVSVSPAVLLSVAPLGMPAMVTVNTSLASTSLCAVVIDSAIAVSSSPLAAETARLGASETGLMVRFTVRVALSPLAASVTV